ncbi:MAG TPA: glycoside hydrolase family 16 protein [Rhizomicrobium sp.]|nr:glycoside hydrolase family 16 protein [Rhizomicrobium sp.]
MHDSKSENARARKARKLSLAAAAGAVAVAIAFQANASAKTTFQDDFNSLSLWDGTSGTWATDYWYDDLHGNGNTLENNGEQEWYINSNYPPTMSSKPWIVNNGVLTIRGRHAGKDIRPLIDHYKYTSGELNSYHSFSQLYGYFEMRAKLPKSQGIWPAFWMLPEDGSWPPELDIMEVLGSDPTTLYTSAHSWQHGQEVDYGTSVKVPDTSKDFHVYAADWEKDYITWYFDGKEVYKLKTPPDMHKPMYIEVNLALGGYWPGMVDKTTIFPAKMYVDYIRAYSSKP